MKKTGIFALLVLALAACGGGGGGTVTPSTPSPKPPTTYTLKMYWMPAADAGVAFLMRRPQIVHRMVTTGSTVVVESSNGGSTAFDQSSPAYVTVSVSPQPAPGSQVSLTTDSTNVVVASTPAPPVGVTPNPSASPAALLEAAAPNTTDKGHTVTARLGGFSVTDNVLEITTVSLVAIRNGTPTSPDAIGFSFDANCNAIPQSNTATADVFLTGPDNATLNYPGGGILIQNGSDVSKLSAAQWQNAGTSELLDNIAVNHMDTLIFKSPTNGKTIYLSLNSFGGSGTGAASVNAGYGCL